MLRRLAAEVLPTRSAQSWGERIHSGRPAGTSNSGISMRSPDLKLVPYGTSGPGVSGLLIWGCSASSAWFQLASIALISCLSVVELPPDALSGCVGWVTCSNGGECFLPLDVCCHVCQESLAS